MKNELCMNKQNILCFKDVLNTYKSKTNSSINKKLFSLLVDKKLNKYPYLIGKIMGDGHLSKNYQIKFIDKDLINLNNLRYHITKTFGIPINKMSIHSKVALGKTFVLNLNYALFGRIMYCLGTPKGNKTKQRFLVPYWITNSKYNSRMFLKGLLEDELTTIKIEKNNYSVEPRLKMAKSPDLLLNLRIFLSQVRSLIKKFGVDCSPICNKVVSKENQKTKELYFHIYRNKENIISFAKNIGFGLNKEKSKRLKECMLVLEKTRYNRKPTINISKIIKLRKKGFSIRKISKEIDANKSSIHRIIRKYNL